MGITKCLRGYFLRGLAVLLPTIITIWIFVWGYQFIQNNISRHINKGLVWLIMRSGSYDGAEAREMLEGFWITGAGSFAGFVIALIVVCVLGAFLASVVGKALWRVIEKFIMGTPLLKQVYPYVKQISDFVFTQQEREQLFSRVVAVEYPRKGIWSIGLVTGSGLRKIGENLQKEFLTVLIPNSPTPITGYVIMVPKEQTIALDMTIEEAFRFAISAGVITPQDRHTPALTNLNTEDNKS